MFIVPQRIVDSTYHRIYSRNKAVILCHLASGRLPELCLGACLIRIGYLGFINICVISSDNSVKNRRTELPQTDVGLVSLY